MNDLITLYILNKNYSTFLEKSIKSALNQSYSNLDIIIIDDGSSDDSLRIIQKYQKNTKIRIITNKKSIGLPKSANIAIRAAKGKYIIRLDADDIMHKSCVEKLYSKIIKEKNAAIIYPNYYIINTAGNIVSKNKEIDIQKNKLREPILAACCLIKVSALLEVGLYNEKYSRQDGYDIWYKIIKNYKIIYLNQYLFYYRKHSKNLTSDKISLLKARSTILYNFSKAKIKLNKINIVLICRDKRVENINVLKKINNKTFLDHAIKDSLKCKFKKKTYLISESYEILKHVKKKYKKKVIIYKRKTEDAQLNKEFNPLLLNIFNNNNFDILIVIQPNYFFDRAHYIEQGLSKLLINNLDKVITTSIQNINENFYKLSKNGIKLISNNNEKKLKLLKNSIFKETGGVTIYNFNSYKKNRIKKTGNIIVENNEIKSLIK